MGIFISAQASESRGPYNAAMTTPAHHRLFFALWPPAPIAQALYKTAEACVSTTRGRVMDWESLHLTLAFLGEIPIARLRDIQSIAASIELPSFDVCLDQVNYWPHNRLLWAGSQQPPPPLMTLAETLQTHLRLAGFRLEERPFVPHITLQRHCQAGHEASLPPLCWVANHFALVASNPQQDKARYTTLMRWPLAASQGIRGNGQVV